MWLSLELRRFAIFPFSSRRRAPGPYVFGKRRHQNAIIRPSEGTSAENTETRVSPTVGRTFGSRDS